MSEIGNGVRKITFIWHDNWYIKLSCHLIIKNNLQKDYFEISQLLIQKSIFEFVENKIKELRLRRLPPHKRLHPHH